MRARRSLLAVASAIAVGLGVHGAAAQITELRVLYVGNSLTATNDLPAVVASLARSSGRRVDYRTIAFGGYSLEDHWYQGDARAALASGRWDVVVMQQGPSALPEGQAHLREWATRFADEARANGTRPALLTVWPESYRGNAALTQGDLVLEAGGGRRARDPAAGGGGVARGVGLRRPYPVLRP